MSVFAILFSFSYDFRFFEILKLCQNVIFIQWYIFCHRVGKKLKLFKKRYG